jgi:hypothetical protein
MDKVLIQLESELTASDYIKANRTMLFRSPQMLVLIGLALVFAGYSVYTYLAKGILRALPFLVLPLVLFGFFFIVNPWRLVSMYKKNKKLQAKINMTINNAGLSIETNDVTEKYTWNEFGSVKKTKDFYLLILRVSKSSAKFIPKHMFHGSEEMKTFEALLADYNIN